ncbi:MAG: DUF2461 family protein [Lachnospiraceae bacterium]|nr:DUF2461 family protein [Lachnospiraceae bacterium]
MFQGFNNSTIKYYEVLRKENSKKIYSENAILYLEGVKYPLDELYMELYNYFSKWDRDLLNNKRRCLSSVYNDARFCQETPVKEYFYIRFKLDKPDRKNALGFFFDASLDGYKYGLNIYNMDARGMERIRNYILDNRKFATKVIEEFNKSDFLELQGEKYKKREFTDENAILQDWLERKRISFIHAEPLNISFYEREILDCICSAFDSVMDVYFMLKEAL